MSVCVRPGCLLVWNTLCCLVMLCISSFQVPLRMMESVESRDMFQLHIVCKDSKVVR